MKKIILLITVLSLVFLATSCKKDEPTTPEPTLEPTPTVEKWNKVMVTTEYDGLIVDSIVYKNLKTNFVQVENSLSKYQDSCYGSNYYIYGFDLIEDYIKGDNATITLYFKEGQDNGFQVLLLKNEDVNEFCGVGGQGFPIYTNDSIYTVTKNF